MKTDELREKYLAFFESKGHVRKPSDVLVPTWDPSVLFTPAMQVTPKHASDLLKAALAIGHLGGSISSPPMQNGYKQIHVILPAKPAQAA